jgi:lysozyme
MCARRRSIGASFVPWQRPGADIGRRRRRGGGGARLLAAIFIGGAALFVLTYVLTRDPNRPLSPACAIRGLDVSRHQGEIAWPKVARAGYRFVWIKATEGGSHVDPLFARNWAGAAAAGLRRGAYLFVYWCRRPEDQAAFFASHVPHEAGALRPVIDVEYNPSSRSCPGKPDPDEALAKVKTILKAVEASYGVRPIVYAPDDTFRDVLAGKLTDADLWIRSFDPVPADLYGSHPWVVWQYSETGKIPGIAGPVDLDCVEDRRVIGLR